jgi:nucleotide-binding universal stress UspA family protein
MFKHILIPTDGSRVAAKAIKAGVAMAKEMGAKVTGYCAQEPVPAHVYGEGYVGEKQLGVELERRAREHAQRCVDEVAAAAKARGVPFAPLVTKSSVPSRGIIEAAQRRKCDVIFMASHGYRGLAGLLLGSVTQEVLTHSKIPVLVFR